ncbi:MAG: phage tail tape measure protein [Candidatus Hydrogenedentes bacterium]|nr:phage tail tape measure protein [Candidatus Hydrogenedentota bacterium]
MATSLGQAILTLQGDRRPLMESLRVSKAAAGEAFRHMAQASRTIGYAFTAIGGSITAATGLAVRAAISWESAFAGVQKTVDATDAELAALSEGLRQMALEIPVSATELARIAEAAGQLGIKTEDILSFTRVIADMSVATNLTSDAAATMMAQFANITQMSPDSFSNLASAITELGNKGATTESAVLEMSLRLAGAGEIAGLSEAEIAGFAAALANLGIEAELGGTAMSKVFILVAQAVFQGGESLNEFAKIAGKSSEDFAKAFRETPAEAITLFLEGLGKMKDAGGNLFGTIQDLVGKQSQLRDTLLRTSTAGDMVRNTLELSRNAWSENNALTKEAEQRYKTTESQLQLFKNSLSELRIALGELLLPSLREFVDFARQIVISVSEWVKANPQLAEGIAKAAFAVGTFLTGLGPILIALPTVGGLVGSVGAAIGAMGIPISGTSALIAGGFTSALAGMGTMLYKLRGWVHEHWAEIVRVFWKGWDALKAWGGAIGYGLRGIFDVVSALITGFIEGASNAWVKVSDEADGSFRSLTDQAEVFVNDQRRMLRMLQQVMRDFAKFTHEHWQEIVEATKWGVENVIVPALRLARVLMWLMELLTTTQRLLFATMNLFRQQQAMVPAPGQGPRVPGMAAGGVAQGGLTWVGERGPELVMLPSGSRVFNAQDSAQMAGGTNVTFEGGIVLQVHGANKATPEMARDLFVQFERHVQDRFQSRGLRLGTV